VTENAYVFSWANTEPATCPNNPGHTITAAKTAITESTGDLELAFRLATVAYYTEYTYTDGSLTKAEIYTDSGKGTKLYTKILTYAVGNLTQMVITREDDSLTLTCDYTYAVGVLAGVTKY
jgi:hypothetical protein